MLLAPVPGGTGVHPKGFSRGPGHQRDRFLFWEITLEKKRVIVFIDGFNLYHAIDDLDWNPVTKEHKNTKHFLKWLNLWALGNALIHPKNDQLVAGYYFSAFARWLDRPAQERHRSYVAALISTGIIPVMGIFKKKPRSCPRCKQRWNGHEEKESDVNLATYLVRLAFEDAFDKAIIFTADTDLAPAIRTVREAFPDKEIRVAIPEKRLNRSIALETAASGRIRITESHFGNNLFPPEITLPDGSKIKRPEKYAPPAESAARPHVMTAFNLSLEQFDELYRRLAE